MKRILALSAALTLLAVFLPLAFAGAPAAAKAKPSETQSAAFQPKADAAVQVTLAAGDGNRTMNMHDYIVGVVAAEMPAKFEPEALKAQAVAARTYAMRDILGAGKHADTGADLCSDPACCQAWISEDQMRNNWGKTTRQTPKRFPPPSPPRTGSISSPAARPYSRPSIPPPAGRRRAAPGPGAGTSRISCL